MDGHNEHVDACLFRDRFKTVFVIMYTVSAAEIQNIRSTIQVFSYRQRKSMPNVILNPNLDPDSNLNPTVYLTAL